MTGSPPPPTVTKLAIRTSTLSPALTRIGPDPAITCGPTNCCCGGTTMKALTVPPKVSLTW